MRYGVRYIEAVVMGEYSMYGMKRSDSPSAFTRCTHAAIDIPQSNVGDTNNASWQRDYRKNGYLKT
jgi:hypothetical protein